MVGVALPFISAGLQVTAAKSVWAVTAYQIAIVMALLPIAGVSETLGYKRVYVAGVTLFLFAALGSILATTLPMLAVARFVQGIGAGAVMVVSGALVRTIYPVELIPRGIGYNTMAVSVASAAGPAVGALVLSIASWPAVFAVSLPFGLLAVALGSWALPSVPSSTRPFNVTSAVLYCASAGAAFLVLTDLAQNTTSEWTLIAVCVAVPAMLLLGGRTTVAPESMVPLDLLKLGTLRSAYAMSVSAYTVMMLITLSFPFILLRRFHFEPELIGLLMAPLPLGIMASAFVSSRLVNRFPSAWLLGSGLLVLAGGAALLSVLQPTVSTFLIIAAAAICGIGFGIFQVPNNHNMLATAPQARAGAASAMLSLSRLIGQTLGALAAALLFRTAGAQSGAPIIAATLLALCLAGVTLLRGGRVKGHGRAA